MLAAAQQGPVYLLLGAVFFTIMPADGPPTLLIMLADIRATSGVQPWGRSKGRRTVLTEVHAVLGCLRFRGLEGRCEKAN